MENNIFHLQKLKNLRKKRNITQEEMSKILNLGSTTYKNYENNITEPNIATIIKLADFYNITTDELFGRKTENLNLNLIDNTRKNLIKEILNANDNIVERLDAFYQGIKLAEIEKENIMKKTRITKYDN